MSVGLPPSYLNATKYTGDQMADVPCVSVGRAPTTTDIHYPILTLWINSNKFATLPDEQGDLWYLAYFVPQTGTIPLAHWVKLSEGSGGPLLSIDIDASTAPGTDPVDPDGAGIIGIFGATVANHSVPIETHSRVLNQFTIDAQLSTAIAATDITKNGLSHFDSASFTVDANGFVQLAGAGLAIDSIGVQTGTNPIVPTAGGLVTINGAVVAAGTNPVRSDGTGANTMAIEVQISQAVPATDATKIGLSNFDSASFTVDANGFVQLTGPVVSFIWERINASQTLVIDHGYMVYGNVVSLALPAVSVIGDTIEIVLDGGTSWTVTQPNAASQIRYGNVETTLGVTGTISSNLQGDYLRLVCQTANGRWNAFSSSVLNVT